MIVVDAGFFGLVNKLLCRRRNGLMVKFVGGGNHIN